MLPWQPIFICSKNLNFSDIFWLTHIQITSIKRSSYNWSIKTSLDFEKLILKQILQLETSWNHCLHFAVFIEYIFSNVVAFSVSSFCKHHGPYWVNVSTTFLTKSNGGFAGRHNCHIHVSCLEFLHGNTWYFMWAIKLTL